MREDTRCDDAAALIGFLYNDCEPDERARIAAHVAVCAACAEELESLSMTREQLSAWTPPEVRLGFRMSQEPTGNVRTTAWWSRPLPAWAQLAAAVVIFAAGSVVGLMGARTSVTVLDSPPGKTSISNAALTQLEQRLDALEVAAPHLAASHEGVLHVANVSRDIVFRQVQNRVDESEQSQQQELRLANLQVLKDCRNYTDEQLRQLNEQRMREDKLQSQALLASWNTTRNPD